MEKLNPCPWCNGRAAAQVTGQHSWFYQCVDCLMAGPRAGNTIMARMSWNKLRCDTPDEPGGATTDVRLSLLEQEMREMRKRLWDHHHTVELDLGMFTTGVNE